MFAMVAAILWARLAAAEPPTDAATVASPVAPVEILFHADLGGQFAGSGVR